MAASTSVLTTATGVTAVIQSGTVQGSLTSTAASTHTVSADVSDGTSLTVSGTSLTLGGGGVLTNSGTLVTITTGVTVASHTLTGAGTYTLDACTVNGVATITASGTISKSCVFGVTFPFAFSAQFLLVSYRLCFVCVGCMSCGFSFDRLCLVCFPLGWLCVDGPTATRTTTFALAGTSLNVPALTWGTTGTVSVSTSTAATLTIGTVSMTAGTAALTSTTGAGITVQSGTMQGTVSCTAAAQVSLTATVAATTTLNVGTATGMTLSGALTASGTINVLSGVTVSGSTLLGNGGTGSVVLNACTVQSGTGSVSATTISTFFSLCCT